MLFYFNKNGGANDDKLGVQPESIVVSLVMSIVHLLLEGLYLKVEADASKTGFLNYCIECFNGRFNWVPYIEFIKAAQDQGNDEYIYLDFANIEAPIFGQ